MPGRVSNAGSESPNRKWAPSIGAPSCAGWSKLRCAGKESPGEAAHSEPTVATPHPPKEVAENQKSPQTNPRTGKRVPHQSARRFWRARLFPPRNSAIRLVGSATPDASRQSGNGLQRTGPILRMDVGITTVGASIFAKCRPVFANRRWAATPANSRGESEMPIKRNRTQGRGFCNQSAQPVCRARVFPDRHAAMRLIGIATQDACRQCGDGRLRLRSILRFAEQEYSRSTSHSAPTAEAPPTPARSSGWGNNLHKRNRGYGRKYRISRRARVVAPASFRTEIQR